MKKLTQEEIVDLLETCRVDGSIDKYKAAKLLMKSIYGSNNEPEESTFELIAWWFLYGIPIIGIFVYGIRGKQYFKSDYCGVQILAIYQTLFILAVIGFLK